MSGPSPVSGVLLVDKPLGITSTDVVRRARRALNTRRVGHAGTLDPGASGVLIVCAGEATKAVPFLMADEKVYVTTGRFGAETWTDDAEGEVIVERPWDHLTREAVLGALDAERGVVQQVPPRISAIKRDGVRMYERARAGEDVDDLLEPRPVELRGLRLVDLSLPEVTLEMVVGKGFYVRSLVRDLGRRLESAAHVRTLRRTRVGPFRADDAIGIDDLAPERLMPLEQALAHLPAAHVTADVAARIRHGQQVAVGQGICLEGAPEPGAPIRALDPDGRLIAVCELVTGRLRVVRGFGRAAT